MFCQLTGQSLPVIRATATHDWAVELNGHMRRLSELTEAQRQSVGYASWSEEIVNTAIYLPGSAVDTLSASGVWRTYPNKSYRQLAYLKKDKLIALAAKRYASETGGMMVGENAIATDDRSKTLIIAARTLAKENPAYTVDWKIAPGEYITLTADDVIAVAAALEAHVAAAFAAEKTHADAIMVLADPADVVAYDTSTGWPANPEPDVP